MSRSWKSRAAVFAVAAAMAVPVIALETPAGAAKGGTDRPYRTSVTLSGPTQPNGIHTATGTEQGTHVGNAAVVDVQPSINTDFITEIAANGDTITSSYVSVIPVTATCAPVAGAVLLQGPFANHFVITGGTGRFAGATGSYDLQGCFSYVSDATSPTGITITFTYTTSGTISY